MADPFALRFGADIGKTGAEREGNSQAPLPPERKQSE